MLFSTLVIFKLLFFSYAFMSFRQWLFIDEKLFKLWLILSCKKKKEIYLFHVCGIAAFCIIWLSQPSFCKRLCCDNKNHWKVFFCSASECAVVDVVSLKSSPNVGFDNSGCIKCSSFYTGRIVCSYCTWQQGFIKLIFF